MALHLIREYNDEGVLLHIRDLIGAYARGRTLHEALAKVPAEAARYCRWLGLAPCDDDAVIIVEEKRSPLQICDADSDVLFASERPALSAAQYEALKSLALRSAADFEALYRSIPHPEASDLAPRRTFYGEVPRTPMQMYEHTQSVNAYYFGEIGVEADNGPDILTCRERAFAALEHMPDYLQNALYIGSGDEAWTLRKVCRRFVWHDRIHARAMYRVAARTCGAQTVSDPFCFGLDL